MNVYINFFVIPTIIYQRYNQETMLTNIIVILTIITACLSQQQILATASQLQTLSNELKQAASATSGTLPLPIPLPKSQSKLPTVANGNQIKQVQYKLQPFINQYVIATIFDKNQELFGIQTKNGTPSWIYLDEDVKEHETCFEDIYNIEFNTDFPPVSEFSSQLNNLQKDKPEAKDEDQSKIESFVCLPIQPIKCMGLCKKLGSLTAQDKDNLKYLQGENLYEVQLMSMDYNIKKTFISASQYTVKSFHKGLLSTDQVNFGEYWVRDFYVSIIGQINIEDFSYMIMSHHKEGDNYYYISDRDSFDDIPNKDIIHNLPKTSTKITIADKTLIQKTLNFDLKFNSTDLSIGLPESLYNSLNKYIIQQIFQSKCTTLQFSVLTCKQDKSKELQQTLLSFCIGVSNCIEISLSEIIVIWEQEEQEANTEESYQYFYMVGKEIESDVITIYPEFGVIYKVLVKQGDIFGFVRHQNEEINHLKQKKNNKQADHEHHEHVEQTIPVTTNSTVQSNQQQQINPNKYWGGWAVILILVSILALLVIGYACYRIMNEDNQGQIGQAEAEEGDLIDGKGKGRQKIFKPVESVEMVNTNENIVSPDSPVQIQSEK